MLKYNQYRHIPLEQYPGNRRWRVNRLMYLWEIANRDPIAFSQKELDKEERALMSDRAIFFNALIAAISAPLRIEDGIWKGRFKDNYLA